ncbi:unnamed protein product [Sphagnum jensenii]|uniref:LAGLIDADG homing endonuclease n=1 Tax=Sphagnum jensenii TaxID=128206 RepID=A0ABP0W456_9BRYO
MDEPVRQPLASRSLEPSINPLLNDASGNNRSQRGDPDNCKFANHSSLKFVKRSQVDHIPQFANSQIDLAGVLCKGEFSASNTKGNSRTTWHLYMVRPALELNSIVKKEPRL